MRNRFTILELMIVITILLILAALLLPILNKAKEKGRRISCISNLRQLAMTQIDFSKDNDQKYVLGAYDQWLVYSTTVYDTLTGTGYVQFGPFWEQEYLTEKQVYWCPSFIDKTSKPGWLKRSLWPPGSFKVTHSHYQMSPSDSDGNMIHWGAGYRGMPDVKLSELDAGKATMTDAFGQFNQVSSRHGDGISAAYVDGSVIWWGSSDFIEQVSTIDTWRTSSSIQAYWDTWEFINK